MIQSENCIECSYKGKREHIVTLNVPNQGYPGQVIMVEIHQGSLDSTVVQDSQVLTFDLDLESSKNKTRSLTTNMGRNLVAKKILTLGLTELELIKNCNIFDTYKDLYLIEN